MTERKLKTLEESLKSSSWYLEEFLKLPKRVQERVQELMLVNNIRQEIIPATFCECIESPIEQIFITAFELYIKLTDKEFVMLFSQKPIKVGKKNYVVDFYFEKDLYVNRFNTNKKIIIECDGHEFHQKTKQQVKSDNEREYALKMAGYEMIRFSGSQIYNEPFKCAEDTYKYIMKSIKEG